MLHLFDNVSDEKAEYLWSFAQNLDMYSAKILFDSAGEFVANKTVDYLLESWCSSDDKMHKTIIFNELFVILHGKNTRYERHYSRSFICVSSVNGKIAEPTASNL